MPTAKQPLRHYEIVFLVHPDQSGQVPEIIEKYKKILDQEHGKIHRLEDWGRRQLAYPIDDLHKAHYVLINTECSDKALDELKHDFTYNESIIRNLILKQNKAFTEPSVQMRKMETK